MHILYISIYINHNIYIHKSYCSPIVYKYKINNCCNFILSFLINITGAIGKYLINFEIEGGLPLLHPVNEGKTIKIVTPYTNKPWSFKVKVIDLKGKCLYLYLS